MENIIELKNIVKTYDMGGAEQVLALRGVSVNIGKNEYVAIMGPSGSGKSTLMNIIGCLDTPTSGQYLFNGINVSEMNDNELAKIRNKEIGFVFQTFNLLARSRFTAQCGAPPDLCRGCLRGEETPGHRDPGARRSLATGSITSRTSSPVGSASA